MSEEHTHAPVPYRTFIIIWIALLVLTAVTVAVSRVDLGALNVWVALTVASVKSIAGERIEVTPPSMSKLPTLVPAAAPPLAHAARRLLSANPKRWNFEVVWTP